MSATKVRAVVRDSAGVEAELGLVGEPLPGLEVENRLIDQLDEEWDD